MLSPERSLAFAASHLGTMRLFALWGVLDVLVFLLAKRNKIKSIWVYMTIFLTITVLGFYMPAIIDFL